VVKIDLDIRELRRNPSEVIRRAEDGRTYSVPRNGKRTTVVITRDESTNSRWVSADQLFEAFRDIEADEPDGSNSSTLIGVLALGQIGEMRRRRAACSLVIPLMTRNAKDFQLIAHLVEIVAAV
jgi:prevent-host-death family protein